MGFHRGLAGVSSSAASIMIQIRFVAAGIVWVGGLILAARSGGLEGGVEKVGSRGRLCSGGVGPGLLFAFPGLAWEGVLRAQNGA